MEWEGCSGTPLTSMQPCTGGCNLLLVQPFGHAIPHAGACKPPKFALSFWPPTTQYAEGDAWSNQHVRGCKRPQVRLGKLKHTKVDWSKTIVIPI